MKTANNSISYDEAVIEDLSDRFTALRNQESSYIPEEYFINIREEYREEGKKLVDEKCRCTMGNWCYRILEFSNISQEIGSTAMNTLDRFISTEHGNFVLYDRHWFQLAVMCALQIAIKVHKSCKLEMNTLLQIGKGAYSEYEIIEMEKEIIFGLSWRLCPPTAYNFLDILVDLLPSTISYTLKKAILKLARRQIYLATLQSSFIKVKPSLISFASMLNAISKIKHFPREARNIFVHKVNTIAGIQYCENIIHPIRYELFKILSNEVEKSQANNIVPSARSRENNKEQSSPVCVRQAVDHVFKF